MVLEFLNSISFGPWTNLVQFLLVLLIGFVLGKISFYLLTKFLNLMNFSSLSKRSGMDSFIRKIGYNKDSVSFVGDLIKWSIYIFFLFIAFNFLFGSEFSNSVLSLVLTYLPRLIASLVILILGFIISDVFGNFVRGFVERLLEKWKERKVISSLSDFTARFLTFFVIVIISLDLLGIYVEVLTVGFAIFFLSIVLLLIFGARDILLNLFAGFYLQSFTEFKKGMIIEVNGLRGELIEVGLIYSKLKSGSKVIVVPNHIFIKSSFSVKP